MLAGSDVIVLISTNFTVTLTSDGTVPHTPTTTAAQPAAEALLHEQNETV